MSLFYSSDWTSHRHFKSRRISFLIPTTPFFLVVFLFIATPLLCEEVQWSENPYYKTKTIRQGQKTTYNAHWDKTTGRELSPELKTLYDLKIEMEGLRSENLELRNRIQKLETSSQVFATPIPSETKGSDLEKELSRALAPTVSSSPPTPNPVPNPKKGGVYNPDIGAVGRFQLNGSRLDSDQPGGRETANGFTFKEAELSISGWVDPYHKFDLVLGFHPEETEIEEGYFTFFNLPEKILLRAGRFRAGLGRLNQYHIEELPFAGRSYFHETWLGGEEGLTTRGIELKKSFPSRGGWTPRLSLEVGSGEDKTAEGESHNHGGNLNPHMASPREKDPRFIARWGNYFHLNQDSGLDLGLNYFTGDRDYLKMSGLDLAYNKTWREGKSLLLGGEYFQRMDKSLERERETEGIPHADQKGGMFYGQYFWNPRWGAGFAINQFDSIGETARDLKSHSLFLTNQKTEFSRYLFQYETREVADFDATDHRWTLEVVMNTGYHRHRLK